MLTKMCTFGAKQLEISTNTVAKIRNATDQELEIFQKKRYLAQLPPYQEDVWNSFCEILNNLKSYGFLQKHGKRECVRHKVLGKCQDALDSAGKMKGTISHIDVVTAEIPFLEVTYVWKVEEVVSEYDEFEELFPSATSGQRQYRTVSMHNTIQYQYPQDFWKLLCAVQKYLEDKLGVLLVDSMSLSRSAQLQNAVKLLGMEDSLKEKKCKNSLKFFHFFQKHRAYIAQFSACVAAYDKKKVFEQIEAFQNLPHRVMDVDGQVFFEFENDCGFDLDQKLSEIQKIQTKLSFSADPGEKNVEYALKWFLNDRKDAYVVSIKKDCENKYRYSCIWLKKSDFIDEPQEYDHILVCSAGIVLIESKYWKGLVKILPDGQLIRQTEEAAPYGDADTVTQMHRHKVLMEKIAPGIPIYNILCLSHSSVIMEGGEFCSDFSIINVSQLDHYLSGLCTKKMFDKGQIDKIAAVINSYKFSFANEP